MSPMLFRLWATTEEIRSDRILIVNDYARDNGLSLDAHEEFSEYDSHWRCFVFVGMQNGLDYFVDINERMADKDTRYFFCLVSRENGMRS